MADTGHCGSCKHWTPGRFKTGPEGVMSRGICGAIELSYDPGRTEAASINVEVHDDCGLIASLETRATFTCSLYKGKE